MSWRKFLVIALFGGILGWLGIRMYEYLVGLQQDRCDFGSTSNTEYRSMKRAFQNGLPYRVNRWARDYNREIGDVVGANPSMIRKISAAHAFARSQGFILATIEKSPPALSDPDVYTLRYHYRRLWPQGLIFACLPGCTLHFFASFTMRASTGWPVKEQYSFAGVDFGVGTSLTAPPLTAGPCPRLPD